MQRPDNRTRCGSGAFIAGTIAGMAEFYGHSGPAHVDPAPNERIWIEKRALEVIDSGILRIKSQAVVSTR